MRNTELKDLIPSEKMLAFKPELAVLVGLNAAVIISQIEYWMKQKMYKGASSQDHFMDGRWWVYNTYKEWIDGNFPWMSMRTIKRDFCDLKDRGLILMREHENFKKGMWVTINYEKLVELIADFYADQNDPQNEDYECQNGTDNQDYECQNGTETAVPEITSIQRINLSAGADTPPEVKPAVQDLMKQRTKQLEAPKAVTKVKPKSRDITGNGLVQAVLNAFNVKTFAFSARLADKLGKPITVRVDDGTFKYNAPVDLYDNDLAFQAFIRARLEQLKNVPGITVATAFQSIANFDAKPTEQRPNRMFGYHYWKKMNAHLIGELKPKERIVVAPIDPPEFDSIV